MLNLLLSKKYQGKISLLLLLLMIFGFQIQLIFPSLLSLPSQPFSIGYRLVMLLMSVFLLLCVLVSKTPNKISWAGYFLVIFWILYSIRVVNDIGIESLNLMAYPLQNKLYYFTWIFGSGLIPMLAILFTAKYIDFKKSYRLFYLFSAIQISVIAYLVISNFDDILYMLKYRGRYTAEDGGTLVNSITMGRFGVVSTILGLGTLFLKEKNEKGKLFDRVITTYMILLGFFLLLLSGSRGPMVALVLALSLLLFYHFSYKRFSEIFVLKWISGFVFFLAVLFFYVAPQIEIEELAVLSRLQENNKSGHKEERFLSWSTAYNQYLDNPIIGDQMFEKHLWQYPHNVILESFMATGTYGGILFLIVFISTSVKIFSFKKDLYKAKTIGLLGLIVLISSLFSGGLYFNPELWTIFAVILGIKPQNININYKYSIN